MLPNIVFGFYGMNVDILPFAHSFWPALAITDVITVVTGIILRKKDLL